MKKIPRISVLCLAAAVLFGAQMVYAQTDPALKVAPRVNSAKPDPGEDFQNKLLRTFISEVENWREFVYAESNFKTKFPRTPVRVDEKFDEKSFGTLMLNNYVGIGDTGIYSVGKISLPYSITDQAVLKQLYQAAAQELLKDGEFQISETKDLVVSGIPAIEQTGTTGEDQNLEFKLRVFIVNRTIFFQMALAKPEEEAFSAAATRAKFVRESAGFFDSFAALADSTPVPGVPTPPQFKASYANGVFRSEYFGFSMEIPKKWHEISQEDVAGLNQVSREVIKQNSDLKITPRQAERRNLFTFSSKPLGAESNASLACNITKRPSSNATAWQLAKLTEQMVGKINFFTVTKPSYRLKINGVDFVSFEGKGQLDGEEYESIVFFCLRKDYAMVFNLIFFTDEEKTLLLEAVKSVKFEGR